MKIHRHLLEQALLALNEILSEGKYADKVIEKYFKANRKWGARDRRFFAENIYELVRWKNLVEALHPEKFINGISSGTTSPPPYSINYLRELWGIWWRYQNFDIPEYVEVPNSIRNLMPSELFMRAKQLPRSQRESIPEWMDQLGEAELGSLWDPTLTSLNQTAQVYLRANPLRISRIELQKKLKDEGFDTSIPDFSPKNLGGSENILLPDYKNLNLPLALQLQERKNVFSSALFQKGFFEVQDAGSQLIAPLLNPQAGERVIDACAGAGGKTLHLASLMGNKGKILSLDIHAWKLEELKKRARRNGVDIVETRPIDSTKVIKRLEKSADALLLDVPCSGLGVLKRNPDAKWKLTLESIQELKKVQYNILSQYSQMVKIGGRMVYATCSILPSENELQIASFLNEHKNEWTLDFKISLLPHQYGFDGFFMAKLTRIL